MQKKQFILLVIRQKVFISYIVVKYILSTHGLEIGTLADEMFGEVGRVIGSPRTVTAKAKTSCIIYEIDWEIVQKKLGEADPILVAIIRGLALRIGDANDLTEKYWRELSIYKSLEELENKK